jgi:hypothetical protein
MGKHSSRSNLTGLHSRLKTSESTLAHRASGVRPRRLLDRRNDLSESKLKAVSEGRPGSTSVACGRDATRRIAGMACGLADARIGDAGIDAEHRLALDRAIELAAVCLVLFPTREEPLLCSRGIGDNGRVSLSKTAKTGSSDAIDDSLDGIDKAELFGFASSVPRHLCTSRFEIAKRSHRKTVCFDPEPVSPLSFACAETVIALAKVSQGTVCKILNGQEIKPHKGRREATHVPDRAPDQACH